ncbi:cache domain-containing sensor histidine kinase [Paenibacillus aceris]|uniref:Two-component system sensor histidine kinase YesM n=1 Tax=Paenibacillus aceris TaxID=869555 RepID=A0ABS4I0S0_9BACL|nr:sensor histidine kinase [Paenibacillus aceris]MBP1964519.1 two-component system sensor histidine kinase YesM [Paenibacillus aceris]NHW35771.1 sensor histidine kinase [Paenibacillus aceris]
MKLLTHLKWRSVGYKLFILFFSSMSISIMLMGYLSYHKANDIISSKVSQVAWQTVQQANRRLELIMNEYDNRSLLIFGNKEIQKGILGEYRDSYDQSYNNQQIGKFLSNLVNVKNDTLNIYILGERSASYRFTNNGFTELPMISKVEAEQDWYKQIKAANGQVVWYGIRSPLVQSLDQDNKPVFVLGRSLKNFDNLDQTLGVLIMEFNPELIQQFLSEVDFQAQGTTYIVNQNDTVVADSNNSLTMRPAGLNLPPASSGYLTEKVDGKEVMLVYDQLKITDWKLVGMAPIQNLVSDSRKIAYYTVYLVIGFSVVAIALAFLVAKQMHKPVRMLLWSMRRAREGDFEVQITNERSDEFGMLYHSFNTMVTRIKDLIDEVYIQKLLKKETQLKMMASQINAHFLYNTLDSIHWISRIYKVDEISTMIFGLSKYLRISLSEGNDFVTVKESAELLESYISIQKVRYQDKFTVNMNIDPALLNFKVLKFVFQPLVENAIYHGLENKRGKGKLDISWKMEGQILIFEVEDDGIGISANKMAELTTMMDSDEWEGEHNFALRNIHSQIQLTYGKEYGLSIESTLGVGTKVTLVLPLRS